MIEVHGDHAGRNGTRFQGLIDGGEDDDVLGDMNDDASACEIGDDFVFAALREKRSGGSEEKQAQADSRHEQPEREVPQT
jgi:hypothetical protein